MYKFKSYYNNSLTKNSSIELFLILRRTFPELILLESFYSNKKKKNLSIICIDRIAEIIMDNNYIYYRYPDKCEEKVNLIHRIKNGCDILENFMKQFYSENKVMNFSGFYGYFSYESISYFDLVTLQNPLHKSYQIPKIRFALYKNIIIYSTYTNVVNIYSHLFDEDKNISTIISIFNEKKSLNFSLPFRTIKKISSNNTDYEFRDLISKSIIACKFGFTFQIVISRQYQQKFKGDEFRVYCKLRDKNPFSNLFYFDYGSYKIFGASPEYQLKIKKNTAYIFPIAGTILRSKFSVKDKFLTKELEKNIKENSEHVMLVDLARNDLSKNTSEVKIEKFKKINYYSHILHIESKVSGKLPKYYSPIKVFIGTFPAGTLSGAPKAKAIELIDEFESQSRGVYGGAIGFFGFDGQINTTIIIRSILSKGDILFLQGGAGVVASTTEENELQEVNNKLKTLFNAIKMAEK